MVCKEIHVDQRESVWTDVWGLLGKLEVLAWRVQYLRVPRLCQKCWKYSHSWGHTSKPWEGYKFKMRMWVIHGGCVGRRMLTSPVKGLNALCVDSCVPFPFQAHRAPDFALLTYCWFHSHCISVETFLLCSLVWLSSSVALSIILQLNPFLL